MRSGMAFFRRSRATLGRSERLAMGWHGALQPAGLNLSLIKLFATLVFVSFRSLEGFAAEPMPVPVSGLHNSFRVTDRIFSGSQPDGDSAFAELARLGVKTIVSVDGAKPDVATARKYGLRTIHLPLGYDGVPAARIAELTRAASTLTGALYVHCHHGKHRGPTAVAIICEAAEGWDAERAEAWLRQAGTADDYPGLYRSVREFRPATKAQMEQGGELPEQAKTPALVDVMVAFDARLDALKAAPATAGAQPATLLWEQLRELKRSEAAAARPADYLTMLGDAEKAALELRHSMSNAGVRALSESCAACHKKYRNRK